MRCVLKILYVGKKTPGTTSYHRACALARLGHEICFLDPYLIAGKSVNSRLLGFINYRTGYQFIQRKIVSGLKEQLSNHEFYDVVWIDSGELLGKEAIQTLKKASKKIVLYNHDDPTGPRDGMRFYQLRKSISEYDICAVVRDESLLEFKARGAKLVIKLWRSYDEIEHLGLNSADDVPAQFRSEVCFIGTWMRGEGRDVFLVGLIERGIPVSIWGDRWKKSPLWSRLEGAYKGSGLAGPEYVYAMQGAKVCLGFLSKGNRDLHTTRTAEIPYAGGVLCAERTTEHLELFEEGVCADFWLTVDECADKCRGLLNDLAYRNRLRDNGIARVRELGLGHEKQLGKVLDLI
jgi:spore maturation protein CgeB